jgi:hypothetical protein
MKHYLSLDWMDYLDVSFLDDEKRKAMFDHLNSGCAQCSELYEFWLKVRRIIRQEREYQVPQSAVRHVKNAFAIVRQRAGIRTLIPRLSFDSLWRPLPVGVRSSSICSRTLLFQSATVQVRLRAESMTPENLYLDGQLFHNFDESKTFDQVPIYLLRNNIQLSEVLSNRFGEFHFDCSSAKDLELSVRMSGEEEIVIPLAELSIGVTADGRV